MERESQLGLAVASAALSKVLDDDNLLIEILLRVAFPTTLVRVALVCKRWLLHVSDRKFLRSFCKLHPPHLLGFYAVSHIRRFVPMLPHPPELSTVVRLASRSLENYKGMPMSIVDYRNGNVFLSFEAHGRRAKSTQGVKNALCPDRDLAIVPPLPLNSLPLGRLWNYCETLFGEDVEGGGLSYLSVCWMVDRDLISTVHIYMLQDGVWSMHSSATTTTHLHRSFSIEAVFVANKIYMAAGLRDIAVFDLAVSSLSTVRLPHGVEYGFRDTMLSRADDASSVYLIQAKELQLRIWLHNGDNWLLVDTICMREMIANLWMSDCTVQVVHTSPLWINKVADNAEFVFFEMGRSVLYLDIKSRTLRKVYEMSRRDKRRGCSIYPLKMIWPPTFPVLQGIPFEETYHEAAADKPSMLS